MATEGSRDSAVDVASRSALAMVMLREPVVLLPDHLERWWGHLWPSQPALSEFEASVDESGMAALTFALPGGVGVVLATMPVAIPDADGRSHATTLWPDFDRTGAASGAHIIVHVSGEGSAVETEAALTRIVATVNAAAGALGVYSGSSLQAIRSDVFNDIAQQYLGTDTVPLLLWVSFQTMTAEGRSSLATAGLATFGLREIEIMGSSRPVEQLREFAQNVAAYLIDRGPVLDDGDTVGGGADHRFVVRLVPSAVNRPDTVHLIEDF